MGIELTEEQIEAAKAEIARREQAQKDAWHAECVRKQREAEERFWTGMKAKYPSLDRDTMYDIYAELRNFYE